MSSGPNCCKRLVASSNEEDRYFRKLVEPNCRLARSARNFRQVFQKRHGKKDARPTNPKSPPGSVRKVFSTPGHEDSKTKLLNGEQKSCLTSQRCDTPIHTRDSGSDHRTNSEQRTSFTESRCCCAENCESNNKRKAWRARKKNPRTKPGVLRYRSRSKGEQRRRRSPSSDNSKSSVIVLYSAHRPALESSPSSSFSASLKSGARAPAKPARSASIDSRGSPSLPLGSRAAASAARAETATLPSRSRRGTRSRKDEGRGGAAGSRRREDRPGGDRVGRVSGTVDAPRGPAPAANAKRQERRLSRNRSGRQRGGGGDGVLGEDAPCWRPVDSELMAQHFNSQSKSLQQQQRQRPENSDPTYGLLMQHLHGKQHSKATSNSPNSLASNDSQRIFPFQATPSGNLKIIPNQVVFESKKVSVLVSDPRHAKVSVKTERGPESHAATTGPAYQQQQQPPPPPRLPAGSSAELPPGVTSSTIERLQAQRRLPLHPEPGQECRPCTQPVNRTRAEQSQQQPAQRSTTCAGKVLDSVPLSTLGFTSKQPINWKNIVLPEKTDLYIELARRITTYKNADCIVRIDNDEFHCHLLVLQSYSTFFDDKNVKRIDLTGNSVTSEAFSIIYDWMISSTSESCHLLRRDNILEIFLAAQQLGIKELEEQCWAFIDNDELFSEDTAFLLYLEARKIGNTAVMELMVPRIMKFFLMLVSTKDFLELSTEELCLLLRSNYICVNSEMEVLMSAVRWLMHDWEVRKEHLLEVMKCVRFGLIAPWQLVDVKRNPENPEFMELISYPEIQKMVDDGLAFVIIKYWYGNQTEDYYHWIDLLGLTEPTNRNWAGEDKHYVTYKEFLLYLEEYQRLKVEEFRNRKFQIKPSPPNSPPKEDFSPQPTSQPKARNHAGRVAEIVSTMSNIRPSRHSVDLAGNNVTSAGPPSTMMSPEILSQYLGSIGRNGTKTMTDSSGMCNQLSTNSHNTKMLGNASDFAPIFSETKSQSDAKKIKKSTKKSKKDRGENILFPGSRYLQSKNTLISTLSKFKKKFSDATYVGQQSQSLMSEEEAATKIQAMYRGYKARRNYKMISENSVKNTQSTKRTHDFGLNSVRKNLNKSLEPVRKPSNSDKGDPNKSEDKNNSLKSGEAVEDIVVQEENQKKDNHVEAISKNLQKIQLVEEKSNETSTASSLIETIMPPSYTNAISEKESSTSVSIRSILTPSYDSSSLLNKHRFTMSDSNKIQNNKISGKRKLFQTRSELQTRRKTKKIGLTKFMKCKPLYVISNSNRTLDFTN